MQPQHARQPPCPCGHSGYGSFVTRMNVRGMLENEVVPLPSSCSSSSIANTKREVATPKGVRAHPQVAHLVHHFPEVNESAYKSADFEWS